MHSLNFRVLEFSVKKKKKIIDKSGFLKHPRGLRICEPGRKRWFAHGSLSATQRQKGVQPCPLDPGPNC